MLQTDIDFIYTLLPQFANELSADLTITTAHFDVCPNAWGRKIWKRTDIDVYHLFANYTCWAHFAKNPNITEAMFEKIVQLDNVEEHDLNQRFSQAFIEKHFDIFEEYSIARKADITIEYVREKGLDEYVFLANPNATIEHLKSLSFAENQSDYLWDARFSSKELVAAIPDCIELLMGRKNFDWGLLGQDLTPTMLEYIALGAPFDVIERVRKTHNTFLEDYSHLLVGNKKMQGHLTREHYVIAARNPGSADYLPLEFLTHVHKQYLSAHSCLPAEELFWRLPEEKFCQYSSNPRFRFEHINQFPSVTFGAFCSHLVWNEFMRKKHSDAELRFIDAVRDKERFVRFRDPYGRIVKAPVTYAEPLRLRMNNIRTWLAPVCFTLRKLLCPDIVRHILAFCVAM